MTPVQYDLAAMRNWCATDTIRSLKHSLAPNKKVRFCCIPDISTASCCSPMQRLIKWFAWISTTTIQTAEHRSTIKQWCFWEQFLQKLRNFPTAVYRPARYH